jgi:predicted HAD superfamily phosphohydrolase
MKSPYRKYTEEYAKELGIEVNDTDTIDQLREKINIAENYRNEKLHIRLRYALTEIENCLTPPGLDEIFERYTDLQENKTFLNGLDKAKENLTKIIV